MMHDTHRVVVCAFLQNSKGEVLLFERTGTETSRGHFVTAGGRLEPGEDILVGTIREMHEELGVKIDRADLKLAGIVDRPAHDGVPIRVLQFYFVTRKWQGEPTNMEPDKHADPAWYAPDALPEKFHVWDKMIVEKNFNAGVIVA